MDAVFRIEGCGSQPPGDGQTEIVHSMKIDSWRLLLSVFSIAAAAICRADGPCHWIKEIPVGGEGGRLACRAAPFTQRDAAPQKLLDPQPFQAGVAAICNRCFSN
jgi:hypothetical protein